MSVEKAKALAESLRFGPDVRGLYDDSHAAEEKDTLFLEAGIRVTQELLPDIAKAISEACDRLKLPEGNVQVYLYNDSAINAFCYRYQPDQCRIAISSGLVQLLDKYELQFVIGHEIGHFLLGHVFEDGYRPHPANEAFLSDSRAKEISADRVGMWASGSVDNALKAMIKTQTGLPAAHIRFDVAEFIRNLPSSEGAEYKSSTHPNFYMRARFLLWASMGDLLKESHKEKCDKKIVKDLDEFFDSRKKLERENILAELRFWIHVAVASYDGVFSKEEQSAISAMGYQDNVSRLKGFLTGLSKEDATKKLVERCFKYREQLKQYDRDGGIKAFENEIKKAAEVHSVEFEKLKNTFRL